MKLFKRASAIVATGALLVAGAGPALASPASAATSQAPHVMVSVPAPQEAETEAEAAPQALPVIGLPVILACVGTVGLSAYQAYNGGDPVEYVASAIIGCIPFGAAAKAPVVKLISENRHTIANVLRGLGATALAASLSGDTAH